MSVLWFDGLLAQTSDAGVYFLPEADVDELLEAAAVNTFPCLRVNLRGCQGREDLMLRLAGVMALPPHRLEQWSELPIVLAGEQSPARIPSEPIAQPDVDGDDQPERRT